MHVVTWAGAISCSVVPQPPIGIRLSEPFSFSLSRAGSPARPDNSQALFPPRFRPSGAVIYVESSLAQLNIDTMIKLYTELRRRKEFGVAVGYVVIGWLLVEVASTLFPTFMPVRCRYLVT